MLELLKALLYGVVEGITEWLPISSTGHMILLEQLIHFQMSDAFMEMFRVVIQLGAIFAVVLLYFQKLNPFAKRKTKEQRRETISLWCKVVVACVPAGVIGILWDDTIDALFYNETTVATMLIVYGVLFLWMEGKNKNKSPRVEDFSSMGYGLALAIGFFQVLALIPGTSRSGATILGAMLLGTSRFVAAEFSFFLAIPVMFGASFLKILGFGLAFSPLEWGVLLVGMASAFVVSLLAISMLMNYIKNNNFTWFGWYRIVLGFVVLLFIFI